jgi:hypothetical protein
MFVLAIKYLQLFFPPRTVSLNYIEAQSFGSLLVLAFFGSHTIAASSGGKDFAEAVALR